MKTHSPNRMMLTARSFAPILAGDAEWRCRPLLRLRLLQRRAPRLLLRLRPHLLRRRAQRVVLM